MYNEIASNKRRTWILMLILSAFILGVVYLIQYIYGYGPEFLLFGICFALISNLIGYFLGDKIALTINGAKEIKNRDENVYLWNLVQNLCIASGLPMPKVYVIEDSSMNAFATGRDPQHASLCFTTGIIAGLENEELEGVVAHELSHVKNYDIRLMTIVTALVGVVMILVDFGWRMSFRRNSDSKSHPIFAIIGIALIILSPLIGQLIQTAISRKREYLADASGALMTRYPQGLASALAKIGAQSQPLRKANHATAHLFFSNPFGSEFRKGINRFFSSHPPIEDRIKKLSEMGNIH